MPDPDITARELAESLMHRWTRDAVTPDPAPYGAGLPIIARLRDEHVEFWYGGEPTVGPLLAALDAANAEVLALREVLDYLSHDSWRCYSKGYYPDECCCGLDGYLIAAGVDTAPYRVRVQHPTDEAIASLSDTNEEDV